MKRKNSLKNKIAFNKLFNNSQKSIQNDFIVLKWSWRDDNKQALIGIAVSKKNRNAVERNKIKREIRLLIDQFINLDKSANIIIIIKLKYNNIDRRRKVDMFNELILKTPFKKVS